MVDGIASLYWFFNYSKEYAPEGYGDCFWSWKRWRKHDLLQEMHWGALQPLLNEWSIERIWEWSSMNSSCSRIWEQGGRNACQDKHQHDGLRMIVISNRIALTVWPPVVLDQNIGKGEFRQWSLSTSNKYDSIWKIWPDWKTVGTDYFVYMELHRLKCILWAKMYLKEVWSIYHLFARLVKPGMVLDLWTCREIHPTGSLWILERFNWMTLETELGNFES